MENKNSKPEGWFSRRHRTREAHDHACLHYQTRAERRPIQRWVWDEFPVRGHWTKGSA